MCNEDANNKYYSIHRIHADDGYVLENEIEMEKGISPGVRG